VAKPSVYSLLGVEMAWLKINTNLQEEENSCYERIRPISTRSRYCKLDDNDDYDDYDYGDMEIDYDNLIPDCDSSKVSTNSESSYEYEVRVEEPLGEPDTVITLSFAVTQDVVY